MSRNVDTGRLRALLGEPRLSSLLACLDGNGEETRIVGGAIRNALLGRPVNDIDLGTTALPQVTMRRAEAAGFRVVPTGLAHGTVTVIVAGEPFEVTTLREDIETFGRHARVRFGRDFAADALRRDFTINALSLGSDGRIHDYTGGMDDLAAGRVRFIGDARARIREDYLRILRFFRFFCDYGDGPIDAEGFRASLAGRDGLDLLSRERIGEEYLRLLAGRRARETIALFAGAGFVARLTGGVGDHGRLGRAIAAQAGQEPDAILRLAAFEAQSPEDAARLREQLRLSNAAADRIAACMQALAGLRNPDPPLSAGDIRRIAAIHGPRALADAAAIAAGEPRPRYGRDATEALEAFRDGRETWPQMPLAGRDLLARGIARGPLIGAALARAHAAWLEGGCRTGDEERARLLDTVLSGNPAS